MSAGKPVRFLVTRECIADKTSVDSPTASSAPSPVSLPNLSQATRRRWTLMEILVHRTVRSRLFRAAWVRTLRACFGLELINAGAVPRDRTVIFAGNHASHYDGLLAMTVAWLIQRRDPATVAWSGVRRLPVGRQVVATSALDFILADEGPMTPHKAAALLGAMIDRLEAGRSVVLHAEGHRCDALSEFMQGAAVAAITAHAPIVPFTLRGVHGLWTHMPWPERWRGRVSVIFHAALDPADFAHLPLREAAPAMTAELRRRVASAIDYPDALAAVSDPHG